MQTKVQKSGDDYIVMLTPQVMEDLQLVDGSEVEVRKAAAAAVEVQHVSDEEAVNCLKRSSLCIEIPFASWRSDLAVSYCRSDQKNSR